MAEELPGTGTADRFKGGPSDVDGSIGGGLKGLSSVISTFLNGIDDDDEEGQAILRTFQANAMQSGLDQQLAKDLAYSNAYISSLQMEQAADLEVRNQTLLMSEETSDALELNADEFKHQDNFAHNEAQRRLAEMNKSAELTGIQTKTQGAVDQSLINAQGSVDKGLIGAQGNVDINKLKNKLLKIGAQSKLSHKRILIS